MARAIIRFSNAEIHVGDHTAHISNIIAESPGILYVIGPNGSGKTILLKAISGLDEINDISYTGIDVKPNNARKWLVPQDPWLITLGDTGYDELWLISHNNHSPPANDQLVRRILDKRIGYMSYGERKILEVIKAHNVMPDIACFDEPYSGLDEKYVELAKKLIEDLSKRTLVVIATNKENSYPEGREAHIMVGQLKDGIDPPPPMGASGGIVIERLVVKRGRKRIELEELRLRSGEAVTIIGPNGSGKTSTLLAIAGALKYKGRIEIKGRTGFVPDDTLLVSPGVTLRDVIENLCRHGKECIEQSFFTLKELGVKDGEKPYVALSDGQRRLTLLIPQLFSSRSVLLLDSWLEGIDSRRRRVIYDLINQYLEGGGVVITTLPRGEELDVVEGLPSPYD